MPITVIALDRLPSVSSGTLGTSGQTGPDSSVVVEWGPAFPQHHAWEQDGGPPVPAAGSGCGRG